MAGLVPVQRTVIPMRNATEQERAFMQRALQKKERGKARHAKILSQLTKRWKNGETPQLKRQQAINATTLPRLTPAQWENIKLRYFNRCYYCLEPKKLTQDHVIPLSKGGQHTQSNIVPACKSCNSRKGPRPAEHYNPFLP